MSSAVTARSGSGRGPSPPSIKVGLGQLVATADPADVLAALGLGSCIAVCVWDPVAVAGAMAHVMLPDSGIASTTAPPGKFADTAVPALLDAVTRLGADPGRLVVKMAGGAQMFAGSGNGTAALNIGLRNAVAVRAALTAAGLRVRAADTGGSSGRTVEMHISSGRISVRTIGQSAVDL